MNPTPILRRPPYCLLSAALLAAGVTLGGGCHRGPEYAVVEGTVTCDGKPLDNAEIVFLPDVAQGTNGPPASAYTDARGHYKVFCDKAEKEGAVVGLHRVCVHDLTAMALPMDQITLPMEVKRRVPPVSAKGKVARVPPAYADPVRTPLRDVEVKPGQQTLDFTVKR